MNFWQWLDHNGCGALIALIAVLMTLTEIAYAIAGKGRRSDE